MKPKVNIENMTYFLDFKQSLNIDERVAKKLGFEEMSTLNGFILSFENLKAKAMVFPSGKAFLSGIRSKKELDYAFWTLIKKLKRVASLKLNPDIEIETQNILASANLKENFDTDFEINLEKLAMERYAQYEPEKFPGVFLKILSYEHERERMLGTAIVFPSGKTLLGDIQNINDAKLLLEKVIEKVR